MLPFIGGGRPPGKRGPRILLLFTHFLTKKALLNILGLSGTPPIPPINRQLFIGGGVPLNPSYRGGGSHSTRVLGLSGTPHVTGIPPPLNRIWVYKGGGEGAGVPLKPQNTFLPRGGRSSLSLKFPHPLWGGGVLFATENAHPNSPLNLKFSSNNWQIMLIGKIPLISIWSI